MTYVVGYEISALLFLTVVAVHFFSKRRFPSPQNKMYSFIMVFAIMDIVLDVLGSLLTDGRLASPLWLQIVVNWLFYAFQLFIPALLFVYLLAISGKFNRKNMHWILIGILPALVLEFSLATNMYTHLYFSMSEAGSLLHGPWFDLIYYCSGFYMLLTFVLAIVFRKELRKTQLYTILAFIVICIVGIGIQFLFPQFLLTGVVIALSITMMYFTMQNPDSMLDPVTDVFNRTALLEFLDECIKGKKKRFYVVIADVDDMRRVNDVFGMNIGNEVLHETARFFGACLSSGWVFRLIGDRFVIVTFSKNEFETVLPLRIEEAFQKPWSISGMELMLSVTCCMISDTQWIRSAQDVLLLSEQAMPMAKKSARGSVMLVGRSIMQSAERRIAVENALHEALENGGLSLYLQPIYSVKEKRYVSAEALVRFRHEKLGMIPPDEFIPIAEKTGLVVRIDNMMFEKLCRFIAEYRPMQELGMDMLELNFSAVDLMQNGMDIQIRTMLKKYGINAENIGIEITESIAAEGSESMNEAISTLKRLGFPLLLDDFGTGYANMARISHMPLDYVKIDKTMLNSYFESTQSAIVLEESIQMCQRLGFKTVIEGVENETQASVAEKLGIDCIQGFYYARPLPAEEFAEFVRRENVRAQ